MPLPILTSIIGAIAIVIGSLVGAFCTYRINRNMHARQVKDEYALMIENRKYEEQYRAKDICNNANVIRLDIATSLFQSIRSLKNTDENKKYLYLLPINKNYSQAVASLSDKYSLKELSYIYQLYGIIEKVNREIYNWSIGDNDSYEKVKLGFISILYKIYGDNYEKVLNVDADKISYRELYQNEYIKDSYKNLLEKLEELCAIENILREREEAINIKKYDVKK